MYSQQANQDDEWETDAPRSVETAFEMLEFGAVLGRTTDDQNVDQLRTELRMARCAKLLRAKLAEAEKDIKLLNWYEDNHTLHRAVECLYVVDGYEISLTYDRNPVKTFRGETVREAMNAAIDAEMAIQTPMSQVASTANYFNNLQETLAAIGDDNG